MTKLIISFFSSKITFFLLTTLVILILNLTPLISHIRHTPPGRSFTLINNNTQDYYFYLALMNEGANGATLTYDPYTSETHKPSVIFSYFLALGKISKLFGLPLAITYHLTRIILGFLLLLTSYFLILYLKLPHPRLTYLFFLFAAPFMHTINDYGKLVSVPFMSWWNGVDPIRRAAFLPHHMLGGLLFVLSIILIFKFINHPHRKYLIILILLSALMAFVHTPSLLIVLLVLPISIILYFVILYLNNQLKFSFSNYIGLFVYWTIGLFFLIVMVFQTKNGFPWSQYIDWEKGLQFPLNRELFGALGILLPFSAVGIYSAIKSKKFEYIFTVCWLIVPFLFIPIAPKFNLSNIRLIQGVPYLPLAILAILGITTIGKFLKKFSNLIVIFCSILFIIFTIPTLKWSLQDQIREYWPIYGNVYLDNRLNNAFDFINLNFPSKAVTLSTFYSGNYLPAYTHTVSFIGHFGYTYNEKEKEKNVQEFFEGKMTPAEAKNFLSNNKITLVFQGPEEKFPHKDYLYPVLLKPVYDKEEVTIYKLNF